MMLARSLFMTILIVTGYSLSAIGEAFSQDSTPSVEIKSDRELFEMSLEDIFDVQVTSVSRRSQSVASSAAAVYVVSHEDIRRTGARTVPEALRMVPGVQVAQINNHSWAISIRGLNDLFSNKLLVLVDGRTVYTPIFSGVFWDTIGYAMEDIERIEVIRGPGATMWGSNAVNGVINIITRKSSDTLGGKITVASGNVERGRATVSYGDTFSGNKGQYRLLASGFQHAESELKTQMGTRDVTDEWNQGQVGLRSDYELNERDTFTTSVGAVRSSTAINRVIGTYSVPFFKISNNSEQATDSHALAQWRRQVSETESLKLQGYYSRMDRNSAYAGDLVVQTTDLDFQHDFELVSDMRVIYGAGWRMTLDQFDNQIPGETAVFLDEKRTTNLLSGFVQSEYAFLDDKARIILGSKFEHNYYTGYEVQPNIRLAGNLTDSTTLWSSVGRAVRVPSRRDDNLDVNTPLVVAGNDPRLPATAPFPVQISPQFRDKINSENLLAYEVGFRTKLSEDFSVDVAAFYNHYNDVMDPASSQPTFSPTPAPHLDVPITLTNNGYGDSWGGEISAHTSLFGDTVRLSGNYSYLTVSSELEDITNIRFPGAPLKRDHPQHQAHARAYLDFFEDVDFTFEGYLVDGLPARDTRGYFRFDASVGWDIRKDLRLVLNGANLFEGNHREFGSINVFGIPAGDVGRAVFSSIEVKL